MAKMWNREREREVNFRVRQTEWKRERESGGKRI